MSWLNFVFYQFNVIILGMHVYCSKLLVSLVNKSHILVRKHAGAIFKFANLNLQSELIINVIHETVCTTQLQHNILRSGLTITYV